MNNSGLFCPRRRGSQSSSIVVNADIRGFSKFSSEVESVEAAVFIKKVYSRIFDEYFKEPAFFKPTGDGLLLVFRVDEGSLEARSNELVADALRLVEDFPDLVANQPIINFSVPRSIGIGLARGAACALVSDQSTLDYSGQVLNLASRLMDFARPAGVVVHESFGIDLLAPEHRDRFAEDSVYVRSIAEATPTTVYFSHEFTVIEAAAKRPN